MPHKGVQVHPGRLPGGARRDLRPGLFAQIQSRQLQKWNVWNLRRFTFLEGLILPDHRRQALCVMRTVQQVTVESLLPNCLRLRVDHLDDIFERRVLPDGGAEKIRFILPVKPALHQPLRSRSQRFSSHSAGTHDLHEVSEHLHVVDHTVEDRRQQREVTRGQRSAEQCRHIFHKTLLPAVHGSLGDKFRLDDSAQRHDLVELILTRCIERRVQTASRSVLGQFVFGRECISGSLFLVNCIRWRNQLANQ